MAANPPVARQREDELLLRRGDLSTKYF